MKKQLLHFVELHRRLKSLEDTVQGSVESGTSGVLTRLTLIEELVNTSGTLRDARHDAVVPMAWSKACSDIPIFGGEHDEYEDWQYKVRTFLNSECSLFARFLTFLESLKEELDMEDIKGYATSGDLPGRPADLLGRTSSSSMSWHKRQEGTPWSLGQTPACIQGQECKQKSETH